MIEEFMELWKKNIQHFKVELRGEFEIKSEDTDFTQDFEIKSDHVGTALTELGKQINIAMLGKAKELLKELFPKVDIKKLDSGGEKEKCPFCGRELIFYNQKWICGHGCTKPAIKSDEKLPELKRVVATKVYTEVVADIIKNDKKAETERKRGARKVE